MTVNETANEPPPEDETLDSAKSLGMEAVFINHNFAQQVLKMVRREKENSSEFRVEQRKCFILSDRAKNDTNSRIRIRLFSRMKRVKPHQSLIVIVLGIWRTIIELSFVANKTVFKSERTVKINFSLSKH